MTKKKWALFFFVILLVLGYFKLFYKTFSETFVPQSADCIIALDKKRIANTVLWNLITTPGQWKKISFSSSGEIDWKDMIKIPDYVFIFHFKGQPAHAWYTVFEIKNDKDFNRGLDRYHFEKIDNSPVGLRYFSKELGIVLVRNHDRVLVGKTAINDKDNMQQVASELFDKKNYSTKEVLSKNTTAGSHLSLQFSNAKYLLETAVIKANFDKNRILVEASLALQKQFDLRENRFSYSDSSLCTLGFTQPTAAVYALLNDSAKARITRAVNFNIDSLLLPENSFYSLDLAGIRSRMDSAVSYSYDDNFNPIQKVVVNQVQEPAFNFSITGAGIDRVHEYWKRNEKLEPTAAGELFTPMPFVKSYVKKTGTRELSVVSNNYEPRPANNSISCIFFLNMTFNKITVDLQKYLPTVLQNGSGNMENIQLTVKRSAGKVLLEASFTKKKNDHPIINW